MLLLFHTIYNLTSTYKIWHSIRHNLSCYSVETQINLFRNCNMEKNNYIASPDNISIIGIKDKVIWKIVEYNGLNVFVIKCSKPTMITRWCFYYCCSGHHLPMSRQRCRRWPNIKLALVAISGSRFSNVVLQICHFQCPTDYK